GEEMEPSDYDRVVYEVTGDVVQLKSIKDSDLLDKKINHRVTKDAKLNLVDLDMLGELELYFREVEKLSQGDIDRILARAAKYVKDYN
ncbi:hypothetical protein, partial [Enterococcus faecalis]